MNNLTAWNLFGNVTKAMAEISSVVLCGCGNGTESAIDLNGTEQAMSVDNASLTESAYGPADCWIRNRQSKLKYGEICPTGHTHVNENTGVRMCAPSADNNKTVPKCLCTRHTAAVEPRTKDYIFHSLTRDPTKGENL